MRLGSLFSGYGGLDMAVDAVLGSQLVWYSEIDPAACRVLAAHHPGVANLGDIKQINWTVVPSVDVLTGGYPCQPFSHAGLRKGKEDERHLWPYVKDAIGALGPQLVVLENVAGHLSLGFADVLADLADLGMSARWGIVRASDVGACHARKRLFIIAYPKSSRWRAGSGSASWSTRQPKSRVGYSGEFATDTIAGRWCQCTPECTSSANSYQGAVTDTHSQRHGCRQDTRGMGRVGCKPEGFRWAISAAWQESGAGGTQAAADTHSTSGQTWQSTGQDSERFWQAPLGFANVAWGKYEAAIRRWESVLGRVAPSPTYADVSGRQRLSPLFVEWMMGLPAGQVTGHNLSTSQALKMLGNGVVPQQAAFALSLLLGLKPIGQYT